jgi:hypothetical protein
LRFDRLTLLQLQTNPTDSVVVNAAMICDLSVAQVAATFMRERFDNAAMLVVVCAPQPVRLIGRKSMPERVFPRALADLCQDRGETERFTRGHTVKTVNQRVPA